MTNEEVNIAVARKLGWTFHEDHWDRHSDGRGSAHSVPEYSASIEAAWEIVDHFNNSDFQIVLNMNWNKSTCSFYAHKEYRCMSQEEADTAPRAICEAFLKLP